MTEGLFVEGVAEDPAACTEPGHEGETVYQGQMCSAHFKMFIGRGGSRYRWFYRRRGQCGVDDCTNGAARKEYPFSQTGVQQRPRIKN